MLLVEVPRLHERCVKRRTSCEKFFLSLTACQETTAGILCRGEVQRHDRRRAVTQEARYAHESGFVHHLDVSRPRPWRLRKHRVADSGEVMRSKQLGSVHTASHRIRNGDAPAASEWVTAILQDS